MNSLKESIHSIAIDKVKINDKFWAPRVRINHEITIPHVFRKCEKTGRIDNFSRAAGLLDNAKKPNFPFDDSDVFKVIEGAAYSLIIYSDSKLKDYIDNLIEKIAAAQEDDGYLYTTRTISPEKPHIWAGMKRWELLSIVSHELYNMGHLIEAGISYYQATGNRRLLDVAIKCADLINNEFGPNKIRKIPGHQEIEIALIRLYRITNNNKYLALANFFLDIRGSTEPFDFEDYSNKFKIYFEDIKSPEYNQSHSKIVKQDEAVGHAVRAAYMYSAVTDIVSLYSNSEYRVAIERIWENVVSKKMYITGGIGASSKGESFGNNYQLPNFAAYAETCAAIAHILWNFRLFLLYGDAKYIDIMERTLYNGFLVGISIQGNKFFYSNPLASKGKISRRSWYKCPCCPTNIVRFIPQISSYIYARKKDCIFVNFFIGCNASINIQDTLVKVKQKTNYPWDGDVKIYLNLKQSKEFTIALRIPGWAINKPVPSDLYHYLKPRNMEISIKVNDELISFQIDNGFAKIQRLWNNNDEIEIKIPMPIRRVLCNPKVKENVNMVAIERGPIVYCIESVDNDIESIFNIKLKDTAILKAKYQKDILNGIILITSSIHNNNKDFNKIHFIPYYAWANRGKSQMSVWIERDFSVSN